MRQSVSTSKATAATRNWRADVDLSRTVGWFTTKYPVSLNVGDLSWAQVVAGDAALGAAIKDVKEQLRALPDALTYGLLRYLNDDVVLDGADPTVGFNYLGRLGAGADVSGELWRISRDGSSAAERQRGDPHAADAHRRPQRRHRRHRRRTTAACELDVGAARCSTSSRSPG